MSDKGNDKPINDLRGAYNEFIKSPLGNDFLSKLVAKEVDYLAKATSETSTAEQKLNAVARYGAIYEIRTLLKDLSTPPKGPISTR